MKLSPPCSPLPRVSQSFRRPSASDSGHNGVDLATPIGTALLAMSAGTVSFAGPLSSSPASGIAVGVHADDGRIFWSFAHMSSVSVRAGEHVDAGQLVGFSGNTGEVRPKPSPEHPDAGAHVHVRVDLDGVNVDPLPFFSSPGGLGGIIASVAAAALFFHS